MDKKQRRLNEDRQWAIAMQRCGINKHPKNLSDKDRKIQKMFIDALSSDPNDLPDGRYKWEEWYEWHVKNGTEY